jgi:hypothetical protein
LRPPGAAAAAWDPATGTRRPARVTFADGVSAVEVPLDGAPAALLAWREGDPPPPEPPAPVPSEPPVRTVDLSAGWEGRLVPTMDNTWGDLALPAGAPVDEPQIWTLRWTESEKADASWEVARATYGDRVRVLPPVPAAAAPAPLDPAAASQVLAGQRPLAPEEENWTVGLFSRSRGIPDPDGLLGNKGLVSEEFVRVPVPGPGTVARVRTIVETGHRGAAELHVAAEAVKRVWWNGERLDTGGGQWATARVEVTRARNVLEYELADAQDRPVQISATAHAPLGSCFCLTRPGGLAARPRFMCLPDGVRPDGRVTYRGRFHVPWAGAEAALVVGAAAGVTVLLDGTVVARQEKAEYYESDWGAVPMFFRHEPPLAAGGHVLEVVADSVRARDAVFVDLVARAGTEAVALVSGAGWEARTGRWHGRTVEHDGRWGELQHCHAAVRAHPLPDAAWLNGPPVLGGPVLPLRCTDDVRPRAQRFRFTVPPGTAGLDLPLELPARVSVAGGDELPLDGHRLTLRQPLLVATEIEVVTAPTAVLRGGSAWAGPVRVRTVPAPMPLGEWAALGLGGWSGGVTYARDVRIPAGADPVLDLGRVRGSVEVAVDGVRVGEAFCPPYRFTLPGTAGRTVRLEITVRNTLAPYLAEATPTAWAFPSQRASGLLGPVTLAVRAV